MLYNPWIRMYEHERISWEPQNSSSLLFSFWKQHENKIIFLVGLISRKFFHVQEYGPFGIA